ncbi:right-handed parallel beta-helix repeat-containing protein [Dyadobacter sp.]|uniref:right-handed parallel beta-helix repeat-containing protein n=1 Tax=Dyadobacter sp. TaxID=1914288 RepID=UPI003F70D5F2
MLLLLQGQTQAQSIYLVDGSKSGNTTASGVATVDAAAWENAAGKIQLALAASRAGDEIWVKGGTYETTAYEAFGLKEGVKIYGHFAGTETQVTQRNLQDEASVTTILGLGTGNFYGYDLTSATVLDGFRLARAENRQTGGGVYLVNSSLIIRNCLFENLSVTREGGAIYMENGSATIEHCIFRSNSAGNYGSAISMVGASPTITNSKFERNNQIAVRTSNSSPTLTDCIFSNNAGPSFDGNSNSSATITGSKFLNNSSTAITVTQSSVTLYSSVISGNNSERSPGGIYGSVASLIKLSDCLIENNTTSEDVGGGVGSFGTLHMTNCVVTGNRAPQGSGGGVYWSKRDDSESMSLTNCVISRNSASSAGGLFGAQLLKNTIIWGNSARLSNGNVFFIDVPQVVNSIIENGYDGEGRIDVNPQFVNIDNPKGNDGIFGTADDGLRLQSCSQAIDAGTNEGVTATTDAGGAPRIYNSIIDIGPYEFSGSRTATPSIIAEGPASFCEGGSVVLRAPEGFGNNYQWNPGGSTDSRLTVTTAGSYTVTITTGEGCATTSAPFTVTTTEAPATPLIAGEASREICPDGSTTLEIANQTTGTWTEKAAYGGVARQNGVSFSIGNKGYIGTGLGDNNTNQRDFWEYDPATDSWTQKADFTGTPRSVAAGFAIGGNGYVGTGYDGDQTRDFYQFDPVANTWTRKADFGGAKRYKATGFSIGSKGYIGFGYTPSGHDDDLWEYDPATDSWSEKASIPGGREAATAFSIGGAAYAGTGFRNGSLLSDFYKYDQATDTWETKADFAGGTRQYAAAYAIGDKGYVGAGLSPSEKTKDFWMYDPATNTWTQKSTFPSNEGLASTGFSVNGKGYLPVSSKALFEFTESDTYTWSTGESTPSINVSTSGTYTVTASNALGCSTTSSAVTVTVVPLPSANVLVVTQPSCAKATGSISVDPGNAAATGNTYALGEGAFQSSGDFQDLAPGTYSVQIKNSTGCVTTASITINAQPEGSTTPVITAGGPTTFCAGGQVTLSAPEGFSTYTWSPGGGNSPSITVSTTGNYTVTVTNVAGCTATSEPIKVTVSSFPVIEATLTQPTCTVQTGTITASTDQDGSEEILYTLNDGEYGTENVFSNLAPGTYVIYAVNEARCRSTKEVTITSPDPVITASGPTGFCAGGSVVLSAPAGFASYSWNPGGATSSSITATTQGDYTVTVTDGSGCSITSKPTKVFVGSNVMYVDRNAATSGNGTSWANAMNSLSDAVFMAKSISCISEIHVAQGTYYPTSDTDRDSTFTFYRGGLKIYGGYPTGGGTRNIAANPTILSGDIGVSGDKTDNSFHIAAIVGLNAASDSLVIDGFNFQDGNADQKDRSATYNGEPTPQSSGGAILAMSNAGFDKLLLTNCRFTNNSSVVTGGAITALNTRMTVRRSYFASNASQSAGAIIASTDSQEAAGRFRAENCIFTANTSIDLAGAIAVIQTPSEIINTVFSGNSGGSLGGAFLSSSGDVKVTGSVFENNTAQNGGAILQFFGRLDLINNTFHSNNAGANAGVLYAQTVAVTLYNNILWNNNAVQSGTNNFFTQSGSLTGNNNIMQGAPLDNGDDSPDPLFVNASQPAGTDLIFGTADDGLRIQLCSPAINAGNASYLPSYITTDLTAGVRTAGSSVDIGAYEYQGNASGSELLASDEAVATKTLASGEAAVLNVNGSECQIIATVQSTGDAPVTGNITARIWVESTQPAQYVKRHYQLVPTDNAANATARVTIYATDEEFNAFNTQNPAPAYSCL